MKKSGPATPLPASVYSVRQHCEVPGEAQMVVEKATAAGLFTDQKDRDRTARLLNSLKPRAEADKKDAARFDAEADQNPAGELNVKSGDIYYYHR
jgi:hypothetical protein